MIEDGRLYHTFADIEGKLDVLRVQCISCERKNIRFGSCVTKRSRSKRLRATLWEMKVGPSGSAIRSLIPSHRGPLWSKATVVLCLEGACC
jgi:hypothetical protein